MSRRSAYAYSTTPLSERLASVHAYETPEGWYAVERTTGCRQSWTSCYPTKEEALAELGAGPEVAPHRPVPERRWQRADPTAIEEDIDSIRRRGTGRRSAS